MADPKRPPGRPPVTDEDQPPHVNLTLSSQDYDRAQRIARRDGVSIPEVIRRGLKRLLASDPPPE